MKTLLTILFGLLLLAIPETTDEPEIEFRFYYKEYYAGGVKSYWAPFEVSEPQVIIEKPDATKPTQ